MFPPFPVKLLHVQEHEPPQCFSTSRCLWVRSFVSPRSFYSTSSCIVYTMCRESKSSGIPKVWEPHRRWNVRKCVTFLPAPHYLCEYPFLNFLWSPHTRLMRPMRQCHSQQLLQRSETTMRAVLWRYSPRYSIL